MRTRHVLAATAAAITLAVGVAAAPAGAVVAAAAPSAVTCGNAYWPHTPKDSGSGTVKNSGGAPAHTGPYGACTTVGTIADGTKVAYDCYSVNEYGNKWTWVRVVGGGSLGWVSGAYLSNGGATVRC
ncbi:SH3 domain-containing protein [Kitasatospora griseola]|uniref:hypothetical protein n=1 Tax=Kitasatospora griseola TaxID=2064 RepID=UPI0037F3D784